MKAEKLTKKVVDSITLDELVYAEYANGGAMGACGTALGGNNAREVYIAPKEKYNERKK